MSAATTTHNEQQFSARGPFEGNTEVTVYGNHFLPSENLLCKFFDAQTNVTMVTPGAFDTEQQVRCITWRHEPLPGGKVTSTIRPCFYKTIQISSDNGAAWSTVSAMVRFLFCDVYISTTGSDENGFGTPDRPYRTLQRGIEAALDGPRTWWRYKPRLRHGRHEVRGQNRDVLPELFQQRREEVEAPPLRVCALEQD